MRARQTPWQTLKRLLCVCSPCAQVTAMGCDPGSCQGEKEALQQGHVHAIAFSSTAEVCVAVHVLWGGVLRRGRFHHGNSRSIAV